MSLRIAVVTALGALLMGLAAPGLSAPAQAATARADDPALNLTPPTVSGRVAVGVKLRAHPGTWLPADASFSYQWLRDGKPMADKTRRVYRPKPRDLRHRISVLVTATHPSYADASALSAATTVRKGVLRVKERPRLKGERKFLSTITATRPKFDRKPKRLAYRWLRDGKPIPGATKRKYRLGWKDVRHKVSVRVTARRPGYRPKTVTSKAGKVRHRVPQRHVVRYHVETRGKLTTSVKKFRRLAKESLNDPRGWRGQSGIRFKEVRSGGSMTLVLAESSWLPRFSSGCSAQWSCRVGRYVIINQLRWKHASPAWNRSGGSLRGYRHMVVNHETGHWLGWSHRSCPRAGAPAPVMQQQSISLQGCRFNPFPTAAERNVPRF